MVLLCTINTEGPPDESCFHLLFESHEDWAIQVSETRYSGGGELLQRMLTYWASSHHTKCI